MTMHSFYAYLSERGSYLGVVFEVCSCHDVPEKVSLKTRIPIRGTMARDSLHVQLMFLLVSFT